MYESCPSRHRARGRSRCRRGTPARPSRLALPGRGRRSAGPGRERCSRSLFRSRVTREPAGAGGCAGRQEQGRGRDGAQQRPADRLCCEEQGPAGRGRGGNTGNGRARVRSGAPTGVQVRARTREPASTAGQGTRAPAGGHTHAPARRIGAPVSSGQSAPTLPAGAAAPRPLPP